MKSFPLCTAGVMPYPGRSSCAPIASYASTGSSGSPLIEMRCPSIILQCGTVGGTDTMHGPELLTCHAR